MACDHVNSTLYLCITLGVCSTPANRTCHANLQTASPDLKPFDAPFISKDAICPMLDIGHVTSYDI